MMQSNSNNFYNSPLFERAQLMAQGKSSTELEQIARNICEQKGIKYEDAYKAFCQMLNNK